MTGHPAAGRSMDPSPAGAGAATSRHDHSFGKADLHIHSVASDGTATIEQILDWAETRTDMDVIAIADHERLDAALAARAMAAARHLRIGVVVGEEVTTRGGHLLALFVEERIPPLRSLRETIEAVHEQGGLAIPAHPLFPYPMCATGRAIRTLAADRDLALRPDAIETFNPTTFGRPVHDRVVALAQELGVAAVGNSDAHDLASIGTCWTEFPGHSAAELRAAILAGRTEAFGTFHTTTAQLPTFGRQLRKYSRDLRDEVSGRFRRERTGRHLGYPGGHLRPPRFEEDAYRAALAAEGTGDGRDQPPRSAAAERARRPEATGRRDSGSQEEP